MDKFSFIKLMEEKKENRIETVKKYKYRDIYYEILDALKNKKMFIFYGLRGIGKSIAISQVMKKEDMFIDGTILSYYNLDLVEIVEEYNKLRKGNLFIDEVNEIKDWDKALKIIYDNYDFRVVATGSSAIEINLKNNYLLRRAKFKAVSPLTFREFLRLKYNREINISSKEIFLSDPEDAYIKAKAILMNIPNLSFEFREFLKKGFPLAFERPIEEVSEDLISKIILDDFLKIGGFNLEVSSFARKIINIIALSKPDRISLSKFTDVAGCSKMTALNILNAFSVSSLIIPVLSNKKSVAKIRKEPKYLFSSPSIRYGLIKNISLEENIGALREDAFVSAFKYGGFNVNYFQGKNPDYEISYKGKSNVVEIGGPSKDKSFKGFILVDDYKLDFKNGKVVMPLFLIGFL